MRIRLFGEVAIDGPDGGASVGAPARKKVLALMALRAGVRCSLDGLIDHMWGAEPPANAERMIRMYVSGLRKVIEMTDGTRAPTETLVTEEGGYRLDLDQDDVDVLRFDRLVTEAEAGDDARLAVEALDLWRGDPLVEFEYDDFAVRVRERLERRRLDAEELRFASDLRLGATSALLDELTLLVAEHPWRERMWQLLITGLYQMGRQAEALRAYDRARDRLGELGLDPGPRLRELATAIARHELPSQAAGGVGNLPEPVDQFFGRDAELARIDELMVRSRLITLVGAGGCGKTRLAIEIARRVAAPAWLIDLTSVDGSSGIVEAILRSLGRSQRSIGDPLVPVIRAIGRRPVLLLIDNCEHVLEPLGPLVERLLEQCPNLALLATSREQLGVRGESIVSVAPLSLPESDDPDQIMRSDAGKLFVARVRASLEDFELTEENASIVGGVLGRLDGIPLAIELVAPLVRTEGIRGLQGMLGGASVTAAAPRRTSLARHRTMTAALEWSYELLDPAEQATFRSLAVLTGEFDTEAAHAMTDTPDAVRVLIEKSMVERLPNGALRMLVPVRDYALELARDRDALRELEARRNAYFVGVARQLSEGFRRGDEAAWQQRFQLARVHLRLALEDLARDDPSSAASLMNVLSRYWVNLGLYVEGVRLASILAEDSVEVDTRLGLQVGIIHMMQRGGKVRAAGELARSVLETAEAHASGDTVALVLNALGSNEAETGDMRAAEITLRRAIAAYEAHRPGEWFVPMMNLGAVLAWSGRPSEAAEISDLLRAAQGAGRLPDPLDAFIDLLDGAISRYLGDLETANDRLSRSLPVFTSEFHRLVALVELAVVQLERGELAAAERSIGHVLTGSPEASSLNRLRAMEIGVRVALAQGDPNRARRRLGDLLGDTDLDQQVGRYAEIGDSAARLAADIGSTPLAGRLVGHADALRERLWLARDPFEDAEMEAVSGGHSPDDIEGDPVEVIVRDATTLITRL